MKTTWKIKMFSMKPLGRFLLGLVLFLQSDITVALTQTHSYIDESKESFISICWKGKQFIAFVEVKGPDLVGSCRGLVKGDRLLIKDQTVLTREHHYMSVGQAISHRFLCPTEKVRLTPFLNTMSDLENTIFYSCVARVFKSSSI